MLYHHTVVIKEWCDVAQNLLCRTILSWRHIIGMRGKHVNESNVNKANEWMATNNVTSCTKCSLPQSIVICCLLRELTASQLVATRSDTGSHNRLNLIQSLVPPHYVCFGYISVMDVELFLKKQYFIYTNVHIFWQVSFIGSKSMQRKPLTFDFWSQGKVT